MEINLEAADHHSIQAYSGNEIKINSETYQSSLIVSSYEIIKDWPIDSIQQLNEESLAPLLHYQPKIIIIGHSEHGLLPQPLIQRLGKQNIGLECMSIGAACRTFNVLLSEHREVVLGLILRAATI
jgi:uncharacterized protein